MFQSSPSYRPFRSARPNHFYFYFYLIFFFFFVARSVQGARRERNTDIFRPTGFVIPDKLGCPGKIGRSWIRKYNNKNKKKNKKKKKEKNKINIKPIIATAQQQPCPLQWLFFFVFLCCFLFVVESFTLDCISSLFSRTSPEDLCVFGFYFRLLRIFHIGLPNRQTAISFDYSSEFPGHDGHGGNGTKTSRKRKRILEKRERERQREKKTGQLKGNWGINRAKKNDSSFFFFSFLVVCVYPIKINLFPCDWLSLR